MVKQGCYMYSYSAACGTCPTDHPSSGRCTFLPAQNPHPSCPPPPPHLCFDLLASAQFVCIVAGRHAAKQGSHPNAAEPLGIAAAAQSSALPPCQQGPEAKLRCLLRDPSHGPKPCWRWLSWLGQRQANGVRHPMTYASSGRECLVPVSATARVVIQYSGLSNINSNPSQEHKLSWHEK